jgi:hypothetical protein
VKKWRTLIPKIPLDRLSLDRPTPSRTPGLSLDFSPVDSTEPADSLPDVEEGGFHLTSVGRRRKWISLAHQVGTFRGILPIFVFLEVCFVLYIYIWIVYCDCRLNLCFGFWNKCLSVVGKSVTTRFLQKSVSNYIWIITCR